VNRHRPDHGHETEDDERVEEVRADHVPHGDIRLTTNRRDHRYNQFWHRRSQRDDCQPDDGGSQARGPRQGHGSTNEHVTADGEQREPTDDQAESDKECGG
jgi:hypothetical protein